MPNNASFRLYLLITNVVLTITTMMTMKAQIKVNELHLLLRITDPTQTKDPLRWCGPAAEL